MLYGERDLCNPGFLSDPRRQRVLPASLIARYASREGQWFHDILAQNNRPQSDAEQVDALATARVKTCVA